MPEKGGFDIRKMGEQSLDCGVSREELASAMAMEDRLNPLLGKIQALGKITFQEAMKLHMEDSPFKDRLRVFDVVHSALERDLLNISRDDNPEVATLIREARHIIDCLPIDDGPYRPEMDSVLKDLASKFEKLDGLLPQRPIDSNKVEEFVLDGTERGGELSPGYFLKYY